MQEQARFLRFGVAKPGLGLVIPESGGALLENYAYHEVFTDWRYVYDPRFSGIPVPMGDYFRMLGGLNPDLQWWRR